MAGPVSWIAPLPELLMNPRPAASITAAPPPGTVKTVPVGKATKLWLGPDAVKTAPVASVRLPSVSAAMFAAVIDGSVTPAVEPALPRPRD